MGWTERDRVPGESLPHDGDGMQLILEALGTI